MTEIALLPGVSEAYVRVRMAEAGGDEIASGKFSHPESSAALAANAFGWFVERPSVLPGVPIMEVPYAPLLAPTPMCTRGVDDSGSSACSAT